MSDYADDLVRRWEMADPRDRWRHTGEPHPSVAAQSEALKGWKPTEELSREADRMTVCEVCGADACFGFDVTVDGICMGDVGSWRCAEHHPQQTPYTREEWAQARADGKLYPDKPILHEATDADVLGFVDTI